MNYRQFTFDGISLRIVCSIAFTPIYRTDVNNKNVPGFQRGLCWIFAVCTDNANGEQTELFLGNGKNSAPAMIIWLEYNCALLKKKKKTPVERDKR